MTWSAPSERTRSTLAVLQTPVTSAPEALAIWTAKVPTPPDAPMIRTCWPGCTFALRTAWSAVDPEIGTAAACSKERFAGFAASMLGLARAYSAKDPSHVPYTSSPGLNPVTSLPTDSTVPARHRPGLGALGARSPKPARRIAYGRPVITCHVPLSTLAAATRTSTSSSSDRGSGDRGESEHGLGRGAVPGLHDRLHGLTTGSGGSRSVGRRWFLAWCLLTPWLTL